MKTPLWIVLILTLFWSLVAFLVCVSVNGPMWIVGLVASISFLGSLFAMSLASVSGRSDQMVERYNKKV
jgi:hypothetical protein